MPSRLELHLRIRFAGFWLALAEMTIPAYHVHNLTQAAQGVLPKELPSLRSERRSLQAHWQGRPSKPRSEFEITRRLDNYQELHL